MSDVAKEKAENNSYIHDDPELTKMTIDQGMVLTGGYMGTDMDHKLQQEI